MSNLIEKNASDIGRIVRGFDFLGYWFSPAGLGIARKTVVRMGERWDISEIAEGQETT